ncbi:MAG TPA: hypothetical protein VFM18_16990 [Methanosarcina sp.]|nr:hypothetical protein [Methanosarcina sp.]
MEFKWMMIMISVFFLATFGGLAVDSWHKEDTKIACYQAQAEAVKQHVEFKQDCSK